MQRYFLDLSFVGTHYFGWQRQPNHITVQQVLEEKLSKLVRTPTIIIGTGRTDTGVHAKHMIAHFDVQEEFLPLYDDFTRRLNLILPEDIHVNNMYPVSNEMHARFSATFRRYKYQIHTHKNVFIRPFSYHLPYPDIDFLKLQQLCKLIEQNTDFASLSKYNEDNKTTLCTIHHCKWIPMLEEGRWYLDIQANRFLHNMVRRIVGLSIAVGRNQISLDEVSYILSDSERRFKKNYKAPANGLSLYEVGFP